MEKTSIADHYPHLFLDAFLMDISESELLEHLKGKAYDKETLIRIIGSLMQTNTALRQYIKLLEKDNEQEEVK